MPCSDGREPASYTRVEYIDNPQTKQRLDRVTRLLCGVLTQLDTPRRDELLKGNDDLRDWWVRHQEDDRIRREREAKQAAKEKARQSAIAKLTRAERRAIGL